MHINEIRKIAKNFGISSSKMKKPELIRAIQRKEGNFDCYGTAKEGFCSQSNCLWFDDCMTESKK
ncbi:MAG: SAP domain-containing protein [Proteobacteria bacterium]|nr:SAP domain-containing protein [Pseudomonadota bacterium]